MSEAPVFANGAYTAAFQHLFNELARAKANQGRTRAKQAADAREKAYHYARNAENDQWLKENNLYGRSDITLDDIKGAGLYGMKQVSEKESVYHRIGEGNEGNLKFVSKVSTKESFLQKNITNRYGRYEFIARPNSNGTFSHVNDSVNMGTLNRGNNPINHVFLDVVPYKKYGNR